MQPQRDASREPARSSAVCYRKASEMLQLAFDNASYDEARCLFAPYPTIAEINAAEGAGASAAWIVTQLFSLSEFCGARDKMSEYQMEHLARLIAREYFYLKISELMLFFHRLKCGAYGRFYGTVDPMIITCALRQFRVDRNDMIDTYEYELRERCRQLNRQGAVSREEYQRMVDAGEDIRPVHHITLDELKHQIYKL